MYTQNMSRTTSTDSERHNPQKLLFCDDLIVEMKNEMKVFSGTFLHCESWIRV